MKRILIIIAILVLGSNFAYSQKVKPVKPKELKTLNDSVSYVFGINLGQSLKQENLDINIDILTRAFIQSFKGDSMLLNNNGIQSVMMRFQEVMKEKQDKALSEKSKANREKAEKFLNENKLKEGVFTTTTGLQFKVIKRGEGKMPKSEDRIKMNYRLRLIDGNVIEDSFERDSPVVMGIPNLIIGMQEALMLMPQGSVFRFWMHPDIAYGDSDSEELPAGSLLDFEVELLEVIDESLPIKNEMQIEE